MGPDEFSIPGWNGCSGIEGYVCMPWKSKDYFLNGFSVKTIALVGIYNQQFKGTILFMVLDFQGMCKAMIQLSHEKKKH